MPSAIDLGLMAAMGLIGNIAVQLMARGYVHLQAQVSAVLEYSALPWAALMGWLAFDEVIGLLDGLGMLLIAGGLLLSRLNEGKSR
jgi:S-adenosylmethionine uptake transporter